MDCEQYSIFETLDSLEKLSDILSSPTDAPVEEEEEDVLHICDGCSYQTENLHEFLTHVEENTPHQHTCLSCKLKYRRRDSLTRHLKAVHRKREYQTCDSCNFKTLTVESLQEHKFSIHLSNAYSCLSCGLSFRFSVEFAAHLKSHPSLRGVKTAQKIERKSLQKKVDRKEAQPSEAKLIYVDYPVSDQTFRCNKCEYKSNTRNNLQKHVMRHHNKTFKCDHCPYAGSNKIELLKHKSRVHEKQIENSQEQRVEI